MPVVAIIGVCSIVLAAWVTHPSRAHLWWADEEE